MTLYFYLIQCWIHLVLINLWPWGLLSLVPSVFIASSPFAVFLWIHQALLFLLISSLSLFLSSAAWSAPVARVCWRQTLSAFSSVLFPEGLRSSLHFRRMILHSESSPAPLPTGLGSPEDSVSLLLLALKTFVSSFVFSIFTLSCCGFLWGFFLCQVCHVSATCDFPWTSLANFSSDLFPFHSVPFFIPSATRSVLCQTFCSSINPFTILPFSTCFSQSTPSGYFLWMHFLEDAHCPLLCLSSLVNPSPEFWISFCIFQFYNFFNAVQFSGFFKKPCVIFTVSW